MATIRFHETTTATPQQFIAGLTDFGPGRSKLFQNSADASLVVHSVGALEADVTEGSGGVWERLHYDWTDPQHVRLTTTDSNLFGGASGHTYTLTPRPDGTTDIDAVLVREGKNLIGRMVAGFVGTAGRPSLTKAFAASVKAIETRSKPAGRDCPSHLNGTGSIAVLRNAFSKSFRERCPASSPSPALKSVAPQR